MSHPPRSIAAAARQSRPLFAVCAVGLGALLVALSVDVLLYALYVGALALFAFLLCKEVERVGLVLFLPLAAYIGLSLSFLLRMPFFSDDIYNKSIARSILDTFFRSVTVNYHYGRFPLNSYVILASLDAFFDAPALAHLFQYVVSASGLLIVFNLIQDLFALNRFVKVAGLLTLLSLPSSTENLMWFTAMHDNLALLFAALSVDSLLRYARSRSPGWYGLAMAFQVLCVSCSEVGYVLLGLHAVLLLAFEQQRRSETGGGFKNTLGSLVEGMAGPVGISVAYRMSYLLLGHSILASPYQLSGLRLSRIALFLRNIYALVFAPFTESKIGAAVACAGLALGLACFLTGPVSRRREVLRLGAFAILLLLLSAACAFPYAVVAAGSLNYVFPRDSYLPGILLVMAMSLLATRFVDDTEAVAPREMRHGRLLALFLIGFVCLAYVKIWSTEVLTKIPGTARYVTNFESSLKTTLSDKLLPDSLVLFSFSPPERELVRFMRPYDYLQWVHVIIGYFNSDRYICGKPPNAVPMTLDFQDLTRLGQLNVTLTGTYAAQFGMTGDAYDRMIRHYGLHHIYHFNYDGTRLRQIPIQSMTVYGVSYTNRLDTPMIR
jgi:hypothetical protein